MHAGTPSRRARFARCCVVDVDGVITIGVGAHPTFLRPLMHPVCRSRSYSLSRVYTRAAPSIRVGPIHRYLPIEETSWPSFPPCALEIFERRCPLEHRVPYIGAQKFLSCVMQAHDFIHSLTRGAEVRFCAANRKTCAQSEPYCF
jgi:hypothetical protein